MNILRESINSENWEEIISDSGFSLAEVERFIDESYDKGYQTRDRESKTVIENMFITNMQQTNQVTERLFEHLKELEIQPLAAYLKIESISSFRLIVTVNLEDYISEKILKAYEWTIDTEMKVTSKKYRIDLSFMHGDENVNIEGLNADGFRLKHKNLQ